MSMGGSDTQTSSSGPPSFVEPYLKRALSTGENLHKNAPLYRPRMNSWMEGGLQGQANVAGQNMQKNFGAEVLDRGQMFTSNLLSGHGLNSPGSQAQTALMMNPMSSPFGWGLGQTASGAYTQGGPMYAAAEEQIRRSMPGVMSQYALAGREGSGLAAAAAAREATDAYRMANAAERQNQMQAQQFGFGQQTGLAGQLAGQHLQGLGLQANLASLAPTLSAADYMPSQQMFSAGQAREAHERARREEPWQRFAQYTNAMMPWVGGAGQTATQTVDKGMNPGQLLMGAGMTAAGLGWSPFAASAPASPWASNPVGLTSLF